MRNGFFIKTPIDQGFLMGFGFLIYPDFQMGRDSRSLSGDRNAQLVRAAKHGGDRHGIKRPWHDNCFHCGADNYSVAQTIEICL